MPTVLITGANRGIGLEFTKQYAADGWHVIACCRAPTEAAALQALAVSSQGNVRLHALDMADFSSIDALAQQLNDVAIDVLINNAGIYPDRHSGFGHIDYAAWDQAFRINSMAPLKMAEAFVGNLLRGEKKIIAAVSSKMGSLSDNTSGGCYLYRSSKAALNMVIKSLALDLSSHGIKAVVLHPGWVQTDMGGPNALINTETSVSGMRRVLADLKAEDAGCFLSYDGSEILW